VYVEFPIKVTQQEIDFFCQMTRDNNPQHKSTEQRVVAPGMLVNAKALGETDNKYHIVWLVEQQLRFKKTIYIDEPIVVRHTLIKERQTPVGLYQEIKIDVKVDNDVRYTGSMKILKTPK
jgi:hypothetical protein